jgi:histidinol phosphatase-like enzyme
LYRQAAAEHDVDLAKSWYVGDRLRDIQPAKTFGGHGILVPRDTTPGVDVVAARDGFAISTSLDAAVDRILSSRPLSSAPRSG